MAEEKLLEKIKEKAEDKKDEKEEKEEEEAEKKPVGPKKNEGLPEVPKGKKLGQYKNPDTMGSILFNFVLGFMKSLKPPKVEAPSKSEDKERDSIQNAKR